MRNDSVHSIYLSESGEVRGTRTRVKGLAFVNTATAGSIILRDGGASGTVLMELHTPAVAGYNRVEIPADGILFETDAYAALTNVTSLTVFYA